MGVVYHGHYAQFFEIARTESIRNLGFSYKSMEEMGIVLPVVDMHTRFLRPIRYDEMITVSVSLREMPVHHKILFHGEIRNEAGELCTNGTVALYFMELKGMKRTILPEEMRQALLPFFSATPDIQH